MGIFTARDRKLPTRAVVVDSSPRESMGLPVGFEAVGEALVAQRCPLAACSEVGRDLALDGASVDEALVGLRATWQVAQGTDPDYGAVSAMVGAWGEVTLSVVNDISCEDPLTGLGTVAHLRTCLAGLYRAPRHGGALPRDSHALVIVDLPEDRLGHVSNRDSVGRALRMAGLGDAARTVFAGNEVIGRLGCNRIAVLCARDSKLGVRVRLLRRFVEGMDLSGHTPRVWIEGLPATDLAGAHLLDELARI